MSLSSNSLRVQVDTPIWEWCRTAPAVSTAISTSTAAENGTVNTTHGRYIYYLIAATTFYRYDTWTDTYIQLASPVITPATWSSMKFSGAHGFEGRVLAASSTTITGPAYYGKSLKGFDIRIVSGTGAGQRRTVTDVADPVVAYTGIMTAVSAGLTFTDTRITAAINQYAGYQIRIIAGAGISQVRRILHHTTTVFTYSDVTGYECDYNSNPGVPSPAFVAEGVGVGSVYNIESSVITVNSAWDVTPDTSSQFVVESGGIFLASSAASAPFFTLQLYDIASDVWYIRSATSALMTAVGTDGAIERTVRNAALWDSGTASATGTTTTLIDTTKNWAVNSMVGKYVWFVSGTKPASGANMIRRITANTATQLTWSGSTVTASDSTTKYRIEGYSGGVATSATSTTLVDTNAVAAEWPTNRWANYRVIIISGTGIGQERKILSNTTTTLTVYTDNPWTTTPDTTSGYVIVSDHDKIYLMLGGQANMIEHSIEADMASSTPIFDYGCPGQGVVFLSNSSGVKARRPQAINTLTRSGTTATCTTVNSHRFKVGDYITVMGATGGDAATYNITTQVVSVTSNLIFTYTMGGTPSGSATFTGHSVTTLTDASKNWTVNGWANYICYWSAANPVAASGSLVSVGMEIASNTATTLTFKTASTSPVNGTGRYVIAQRAAHGSGATESGIVTTGGSTTVITDSTKSWAVNAYTGKRLKKTAGAGQADIEGIISSNTATTITITVAGTSTVASSTSYSILDEPVRGLATSLIATSATSDSLRWGKFMFSPRGGAVFGWDRYNFTTNRWEIMSTSPQIETLTSGANYAYDGGDRVYFNVGNTSQKIYYLDIETNWVHGAGQYPYLAPTATIGNRMEIIETVDGLKYMWINRAGNIECFKQLLFY